MLFGGGIRFVPLDRAILWQPGRGGFMAFFQAAIVSRAAGRCVIKQVALPLWCWGLVLALAGAAWGQNEQGSKPAWTSLGLGGGGAMFTPAISPADSRLILLNCDMSGAYRSTDGGKSWEMIHYRQLSSSTHVRPAWHPADPNAAFAAGGDRGPLKVTRDRGKTWSIVPGGPSAVSAIAIDPGQPDRILVGTGRTIARSTDGGKSWQEATGPGGHVLEFHFDQTSPVRHRTCFASTERSILRSDDGGATWRDLGARFGSASGPIVSFTGGSNKESQSCVLYCSIASRAENGQIRGGIYRSDDRGQTWTRAMGDGIDLRAEPDEGQPPQPAQYEFVLTTDVNPARVYAALSSNGKVFRSDDRGATWRSTLVQSRRSPGFNVSPNYRLDETNGWGEYISGFGINAADPDHVIVTDWMDCLITHDGGKTWEAAHTRSAEDAGRRGKGMRWINTGLVVTTVWHYYLDPFEPDRHYIAYTDIGFARSTDAGRTWYWQFGRPLRNTTYELAFDPQTPGTIWAAFADLHDIPNYNVIAGRHYSPRASGGVGISTDFGATWKDTSRGLPGKPITSVVVDPKSPAGSRTLYASAFEDGVYKSTDGGKSWAKVSQGLGAPGINVRACRIILHPDGTLFCLVTALRKEGRYIAQGPGLYRSSNGAATWEWINRSQPLLWPKDYDVDPRDSRVIYLGAADAGNAQGGLYKTADGGASWARVARKGGDCFGATVCPRRPDWVYLCIAEGDQEPGLWLSKDAGQTWKALDGMPFRNAQRVTFDPRDDSVIYVSTFGGSVWRGPAD
jgi:photosystem II stability/assembly factor-like uncharacterized protein